MTAGTAVCGFYGRANLGDEAILAGIVDALAQARPGERTLALSADPADTRRQHGIEAAYLQVSAKKASGRQLVRAVNDRARLAEKLLSCERFVLGGGDLLRDSPTQEVVAGWMGVLRDAQRLRRRTAVVGISVGDLWKQTSKDTLRRALDQTQFVITRDVPSTERLKALDVQTSVETAPDLALRVFPADDRTTLGHPGPARVLVSVRGLADRADAAEGGSSGHEAGVDRLARALDALVEQHDVAVELVPFRSLATRNHPVDDDYVAGLELAHRARHGHRFTVHRHVPDVATLREMLREASLVIGMRLHSVIMAVGLGVPVMALSYDRKVSNFCHEVGLDDVCWNVEDADVDTLTTTATKLLTGPLRVHTPAAQAYRAGSGIVVDRLRQWT